MATLNVIDLTGTTAGTIEVSDEVFAGEVKEHLLWEVVRYQRAARRAGTAKTKERGEVALSKMKIYKQKGTGNARHGNRRVNTFRGGGQVHGPRPRSYEFHVNRKVMASALRSAISLRAKAGNLLVVRAFEGDVVKTKALAAALSAIDAPKALLVDSGDNRWLRLSSRNLTDANFLDVRGLNVYDILRYPKLLIAESVVRDLDARLTPKRRRAEGDVSSEATS
jgi:large subunit ribosomal protein L4